MPAAAVLVCSTASKGAHLVLVVWSILHTTKISRKLAKMSEKIGAQTHADASHIYLDICTALIYRLPAHLLEPVNRHVGIFCVAPQAAASGFRYTVLGIVLR